MSDASQLAERDCWQVSGLRDAETFFRAIPQLLPEMTHMCVEGAPVPEILTILANHAYDQDYRAPAGTFWSWPRRNQRFTVIASSSLFAQLAEAATHHAEPEICNHLHFYKDATALAQWFDAFDDPFLVSKVISRNRLEQFARATGGELAGSTA